VWEYIYTADNERRYQRDQNDRHTDGIQLSEGAYDGG
jgi:hypothetical protein